MKKLTMSLVGLLSMGVLAGNAEASDRHDRGANRQEAHQNVRENRDDKRDLAMMDELIRDFDLARRRNDRQTLNRIDVDLRYIVEAEINESRRELSADRAEVRRDNREVREERRDVSYASYRDGDDRRDLRDGRRDRRDDLRDLKLERAELEKKERISRDLLRLYGRYDHRRMLQKRAIMVELAQMNASELRKNRQEMREDHHERREDRRDNREDWRR